MLLTAVVVAATLLVSTTRDLSAHRRDELLQAARLAIVPDRIELQLDLTPGIELADTVIARIDRDRDGAFSAEEKAAYVADVMAAVAMRIDDGPIGIPPPSAEFPAVAALGSGDATIRLSSTIALPRLGGGPHAVSFRNDHHPESSVYLANALAPSGDRIVITRQTRDPEQRGLTIDFSIGSDRFATIPVWACGVGLAAWLLYRRRWLASPYGTQRS